MSGAKHMTTMNIAWGASSGNVPFPWFHAYIAICLRNYDVLQSNCQLTLVCRILSVNFNARSRTPPSDQSQKRRTVRAKYPWNATITNCTLALCRYYQVAISCLHNKPTSTTVQPHVDVKSHPCEWLFDSRDVANCLLFLFRNKGQNTNNVSPWKLTVLASVRVENEKKKKTLNRDRAWNASIRMFSIHRLFCSRSRTGCSHMN